ncbi:MAG: hypothetical protein WAL99_06105 [Pseudonocardiaceae bacterium]
MGSNPATPTRSERVRTTVHPKRRAGPRRDAPVPVSQPTAQLLEALSTSQCAATSAVSRRLADRWDLGRVAAPALG